MCLCVYVCMQSYDDVINGMHHEISPVIQAMTSSTVALGQAWSNLGVSKIVSVQKETRGNVGRGFDLLGILLHLVDEKELLSEVLRGRALQLSQAPRIVSAHKGFLNQAVHQSVLLLVGHKTWSCPSYPGQIGRSAGG